MSVVVDTLPGVRRVEHVMGMPIVVDVRDDEPGGEVLDELFDWLRWVDATFSTYKYDSEISRLNRGELELQDAHPHVRDVLLRCEELRVETRCYFDITVLPGVIDPSGLVKGWSVDRAAAILDEAGLHNYAVNAGGDMRLRGRAVPQFTWSVGIQHPLELDRIAAVVEASDLAIATSGAYARRSRPRSAHGSPADGRPLRDRRRARTRHGGRICDRRVRNGPGRGPALDDPARRLRGDDDPRR